MTAGRLVAAYIGKLLADIRARESGLESRRATVLTTSLTLDSAQAMVLGLLVTWSGQKSSGLNFEFRQAIPLCAFPF